MPKLPDWLNQMLPARDVERDYGLAAGTVRSYVRYHPELAQAGDFEKLNNPDVDDEYVAA